MTAIATAITFQCELDKLAALKPPSQVLEAAKQASHAIVAGLTPPKDLVQFVTRWIQQQQGQNRYGK